VPSTPPDTVLGSAILERLTALSTALRRAGIPVTQAETLDAVHALAEVDLGDRRQVREALAAVSLTSGAQRPTFDALFDLAGDLGSLGDGLVGVGGDGIDAVEPGGVALARRADDGLDIGDDSFAEALCDLVHPIGVLPRAADDAAQCLGLLFAESGGAEDAGRCDAPFDEIVFGEFALIAEL